MRRPFPGDPEANSLAFTKMILAALDEIGVDRGDEFYVGRLDHRDLNGPGLARRSDPSTAKAAAEANIPAKKTQRGQIILSLGRLGEAIADEISDDTGIEFRSLTPRLGLLKQQQVVRETGEERLGRRRSAQRVVELTDKGRGWYAALR